MQLSAASSPATVLSFSDLPPTSDDILEDETIDGYGEHVCMDVCVCARMCMSVYEVLTVQYAFSTDFPFDVAMGQGQKLY